MTPTLAHIALAILAGLFDSIWEGASIVGVVWLGLRCLPKLGAATRYAIWLCTLAALIVIPVLTVTLSGRPQPAPVSGTASVAHPLGNAHISRLRAAVKPTTSIAISEVATAAVPSTVRITVPQALAIAAAFLWMLAASLRCGMLCANLLDLVAIRRTSRPWLSGYEYPVLLSERTKIPLAIGFLRPAIVLPASLVGEQSNASIETIIVHESAHLRRYDVWTNALARIMESFVVLNPVAWFVVRNLAMEREIACDDWVVARLDAGEVFAKALAAFATCGIAGAPLGAPSAIGSRHSLVSRIERLLNAAPRHLRLSKPALGGTLMLLAIFAILVQSISPILAYASPNHTAMQVSSGCAVPNRGIQVRMVLYTHAEKKTWFMPLPTKREVESHDGTAGLVPVDVTVDASGVARKVVVESNTIAPRIKKQITQTIMGESYKPAIVHCTAIASTSRTWLVVHLMPPLLISMVSPSYPDGWSAQHPSACKVPNLIHGVVPALPKSLMLPLSGKLSATARVRVNAGGSVTSATILVSSGKPAFDKVVLAAARAATFPLKGSTGFKPVRPSNATLAWNATHGYSAYSKCTPLPTTYLWEETYQPN